MKISAPTMMRQPLGLAIVFTVLLGLAGCRWGNESSLPPAGVVAPDKQQVSVYFSKSSGKLVVLEGVVRSAPTVSQKPTPTPPADPPVQKLHSAVETLLQGPTPEEITQGYFSDIPQGTKLLSVQRDGKVIRVNLSQRFTEGGGSSSMQQRLSELERTIRAVEKQVPVYVDIEGQELRVLGGEGVVVQEPINQGRQNIN